MVPSLKSLLDATQPVLAPLVLNPMMARMAERAGFTALYLGGGASGYAAVFTEANLTLTEMVDTGLDIGAACRLPLILDGACGWGDPMHLHRTIALAERAGFQAIEIEDQILPKRAHHHIGIEHMIEAEAMADKVREAVAVRRDENFLIIARTNALRSTGRDDALRRAELYAKAGADLIMPIAPRSEMIDGMAERLGVPLAYILPAGGLAAAGLSLDDLAALGVRLAIDAQTALLAMHRAIRDCYAATSRGAADPLVGASIKSEEAMLLEAIGLETLLAAERRTVER